MQSFDISVLITCFNERETILPTIQAVANGLRRSGVTWEIIVVDDASTDGSVEIVSRFSKNYPELNIQHRVLQTNQGLVANVFETAKTSKGRYFWTVAGDNNVPEETCARLLSYLGKADMIIPQVKHVGRPLGRHIISIIYAFLIRSFSGCSIRYYNGSTIYRRQHLVSCQGDMFGINYGPGTILKLLSLGASYVEVPVTYTENRRGWSSATKPRNLLEVVRFLGNLAMRRPNIYWQVSKELQSRNLNPENLD
jgi:glycosyltransferase involved in cell wall biosynthesis